MSETPNPETTPEAPSVPGAVEPAAEPPAVKAEEFPFQAEVQKVLALVIDSRYANQERHPRLPEEAPGVGEGPASHRPVRRRLLRRLHGGRPGGRAVALHGEGRRAGAVAVHR